MNQLALSCFFILSLFFLASSCKNNANAKKRRVILFENTQKYDDKVKTFTIDPKAASKIYSNWYIQKFNIKDPQKVKSAYELIIDDSYFYCYNRDKINNGIPLVGVLINGKTGEITEINLGIKVLKTNSGYKEIKME